MPRYSKSHQTIALPIGPLWTRGDLVKAPSGASPKIRNATLRRGQIEKRPGWLYEATIVASTTPTSLHRMINTTTENIIYGGSTATGGAYRNSSAAWVTLGTNIGITIQDSTNYKDQIFFVNDGTGTTKDGSLAKFDGTTLTDNVTLTRISGTTIESFNGRIYVGSPSFKHNTGGSFSFDFDNTVAGQWTIAGTGSPTVSADPSLFTIKHATDNTITSDSALYTTGASEEWVTVSWQMKAAEATSQVPITIVLQDNAGGTNIWGEYEFDLPTKSTNPEWIWYIGSALVPASSDVFVQLKLDNTGSNATVDDTLYIGDEPNSYGVGVYPGKFSYPFGSISGTPAVGTTTQYRDRFYWSEPLDETDWRNENFGTVDDVPGLVTAIRSTKNKIIVFKKDAMWVFRPVVSVLTPLLRENYMTGIGCVGVKAIEEFDDVLFFVGENEVYMYDGAAYPTPLGGEGMKDDLFKEDPDNAGEKLVATPVIAVDTDLREVWVHTQKYKIHIYSLDQQQWVGYYQLTDSSASETPFGTTYGDIVDMLYMKPANESNREMWIIFTNASGTNVIAKLRAGGNGLAAQTKDDLDGTERDIVAEYVFHPIETGRPRRIFTVQKMGIDHKVTATQTGTLTRYAVSLDGGGTYGKYNEVTLNPLSTAGDADTEVMRVPISQTASRMVLKMQHTGLGGSDAFNITGGQVLLLARGGEETQISNPTASSDTL